MPIYEYRCRKCERTLEVIQKFSDPPLRRCTYNGCSGTLEKLVSVSAFHLKGGGWYADGYARKASKKKASSESSSSSDTSSSTSKSKSDKGSSGSAGSD